MRLSKIVVTTIDDTENEKLTEVIEYGPFDTTDMHPVQALVDYLSRETKPEIFTGDK